MLLLSWELLDSQLILLFTGKIFQISKIQKYKIWDRRIVSSFFSSQERASSLDLEVTERRKFEVVPSPIASSSNPWVPIIPSPPTRAPHPHFDLSLHSGSSSSKDQLPRSRQASHQEVPKRQQYQDRPPKLLQDRPKGPPRKRPPQLWRSRRKPAPRRQIKLVLERQKPLINLVPNINQLVPKWSLVPKSNLVPKRRQTAKLPSPPSPRSKASKSLRAPPQPKRFETNISSLELASIQFVETLTLDTEIVKY